MRPLRLEDIGGARVGRTFRMGGASTRRGQPLSLDDLRAMPVNNRNALIEKGFIEVWPKGSGVAGVEAGSEPAERFVVQRGFGRYDVIAGTKLNESTLTREAAHALAGVPLPDKRAKTN